MFLWPENRVWIDDGNWEIINVDGWKGISGVGIWFCMSTDGIAHAQVDLPLFRGCTYIPITFYELCNGFLMVINKPWPL
jgi:hypothetical protein